MFTRSNRRRPSSRPNTVRKGPAVRALTSRDDWLAKGKSLRQACPRGSHAAWSPPPDRPDPVQLIRQANEGRIPSLVPIRHGRMFQSPERCVLLDRFDLMDVAVKVVGDACVLDPNRHRQGRDRSESPEIGSHPDVDRLGRTDRDRRRSD